LLEPSADARPGVYRGALDRTLSLLKHSTLPLKSLAPNLSRPSNKHYSSLASQIKLELPSPDSVLLATLAKAKHDKWGFVVYRCTYQDDHAWQRFKQIMHERT